MTNPLEVLPDDVVMSQLTSDSSLLIRRQDIVQRWCDVCDLSVLLQQEDERWMDYNVLGQVVNILRECNMPQLSGIRPQLTTHVTIPAWYEAGISLFVRQDSELCETMKNAPELPLCRDTSGKVRMCHVGKL